MSAARGHEPWASRPARRDARPTPAERLAEHRPDDAAFAALRIAFETTPGLRIPDVIHNADHFNGNAWRPVVWRAEP